jgi:hypothetical protein
VALRLSYSASTHDERQLEMRLPLNGFSGKIQKISWNQLRILHREGSPGFGHSLSDKLRPAQWNYLPAAEI